MPGDTNLSWWQRWTIRLAGFRSGVPFIFPFSCSLLAFTATLRRPGRPILPVALHQPAVELRQRPLLPGVTSLWPESGPQPLLHHAVRENILPVEVVDARLRRLK